MVHDEREILHALTEDELFARILSVAGPVKAYDGILLVLRCLFLGELADVRDILAAAIAMRADDDTRIGARILRGEELASHAVSVFVDIEMFFHEK